MSAACKAIQDAETKTNALTTGIKNAFNAKDVAAELYFRDQLFGTYEPRLASAIAANKKLPSHKRATLEECFDVASVIDPGTPQGEHVSVYPKIKSSGGFRMIHKFGLRNRVVQELVSRDLAANYAPRKFQYTTAGVPKAVARIKKAILTGHVHFARLDIENFFPSFTSVKLVSVLPCPQGTVEGVVLGQLLNIRMDKRFRKDSHTSSLSSHSIKEFILAARLGIPQGSVCSPIVSSYCVSHLAWPFMLGVTLTNYADDFLLLASSAMLRDEAAAKLTQAVSELPGGHFKLKPKAMGQIADECEFLSHRFSHESGILRTSPSSGASAKLDGRLIKLEKKLSHPKTGVSGTEADEKSLADMFALVNRWAAFFRECDDIDGEVLSRFTSLGHWCNALNFEIVKVQQAAKSIVAYSSDDFEQYDG